MYYSVERHAQLAVLAHHADRLILALVTLLALPETVSPQREHGHLPRQFAHTSHHAVSRAAIHEVVIHARAHLEVEPRAVGVVGERHGRIVVKIQAVALYRLEEGAAVLQVALYKVFLLVALVHLAGLELAQSVDGLGLVQAERLAYAAVALVRPTFYRREHRLAQLPEQASSGSIGESRQAVCLAQSDADLAAFQRHSVTGLCNLKLCLDRSHHHGEALLTGCGSLRPLHHADYGRRIKHHLTLELASLDIHAHALRRTLHALRRHGHAQHERQHGNGKITKCSH